jgi:hypothetical protein
MDFITGDKFIKIADYCYFPDGANDNNILENTFNVESIKEGKIYVYSHTHHVRLLFDYINKHNITNDIILITHNSDVSVDMNLFLKKPNNIIKWFSQNINFDHENLISIPIGLENYKWFPDIGKKEKMIKKLSEEKKYKNLLYVNHNINNFPSERTMPYQIFKNKNWATIVNGQNGQNFDEYLDDLYNHKFIISPRGVGLDTHRLWESLYMGTIPIEKVNKNNINYIDLPICYVNNWDEITEDFLNEEYVKIINKNWNLEKLNFDFWVKSIKN